MGSSPISIHNEFMNLSVPSEPSFESMLPPDHSGLNMWAGSITLLLSASAGVEGFNEPECTLQASLGSISTSVTRLFFIHITLQDVLVSSQLPSH